MAIDFAQHTSKIKLFAVIPVLVGMLTLIEGFLPLKAIDTVVVSKSENYRLKTNSTTYTVTFEALDDQFTEDIYNALESGDPVQLSTTYFNKQVSEVTKTESGQHFTNDTSESLAIFGFAIAFLLTGLVWFKSGTLKNTAAKFATLLIIFSVITGARMFL